MDVTKYVAGSVLLGGIFIAGLATAQVAAMQINAYWSCRTQQVNPFQPGYMGISGSAVR
ncbi:hypothetical protein [Paracidobacterium acidisoli]|uniref:hypothetical protein n=1 Tax=Paracidobacterium acidisoli TaxID=2303751 RepID=UPI0013148D2D|nr:hypothetical protein [Paracidobacterium acidisoli]MBT9331509.1 hypothetical protein [Paracidobacterium acidisoli]